MRNCKLVYNEVLFFTDNIALFKPTWQQSTIGNWGSNLAVDGRKTDLSANGGQCSISANSKLTAEWRVDLKNVSSIHHVTIQYRTDNIHWSTCFLILSFKMCTIGTMTTTSKHKKIDTNKKNLLLKCNNLSFT